MPFYTSSISYILHNGKNSRLPAKELIVMKNIKKTARKLLTTCIALAIAAGVAVPAFAASAPEGGQPEGWGAAYEGWFSGGGYAARIGEANRSSGMMGGQPENWGSAYDGWLNMNSNAAGRKDDAWLGGMMSEWNDSLPKPSDLGNWSGEWLDGQRGSWSSNWDAARQDVMWSDGFFAEKKSDWVRDFGAVGPPEVLPDAGGPGMPDWIAEKTANWGQTYGAIAGFNPVAVENPFGGSGANGNATAGMSLEERVHSRIPPASQRMNPWAWDGVDESSINIPTSPWTPDLKPGDYGYVGIDLGGPIDQRNPQERLIDNQTSIFEYRRQQSENEFAEKQALYDHYTDNTPSSSDGGAAPVNDSFILRNLAAIGESDAFKTFNNSRFMKTLNYLTYPSQFLLIDMPQFVGYHGKEAIDLFKRDKWEALNPMPIIRDIRENREPYYGPYYYPSSWHPANSKGSGSGHLMYQ